MKLLLLVSLCAGMARAALLTPYFGPGSELEMGGDVNHGILKVSNCYLGDCLIQDGYGPQFRDLPWDVVGEYGARGAAAVELGSFIADFRISGYAIVYCHDDICEGSPPVDFVSFFVAIFGRFNLFVDAPRSGVLSFDRFENGDFVSRYTANVGPGVTEVPTFDESLATSFLPPPIIGQHDLDIERIVELRNIQLTPEPGSLWLVGAALAGLPFTRVRRRRH